MTQPQKLRLEIPLLLPSLPDIRDRCVKLLIQTLESREGIAAAHVADAATGALLSCASTTTQMSSPWAKCVTSHVGLAPS